MIQNKNIMETKNTGHKIKPLTTELKEAQRIGKGAQKIRMQALIIANH
jgi:hypothetical protein